MNFEDYQDEIDFLNHNYIQLESEKTFEIKYYSLKIQQFKRCLLKKY